jgi:hypothetical protein
MEGKQRKGYYYSPMTEQYYRLEKLTNDQDMKNNIIDNLVGSNGIICGRPMGNPRFCDTRMLHYQSGRMNTE